jgi:hypothetical protein
MVSTVKLSVMDDPPLDYEKIITIKTRILTNSHQYQVMIGNFPSCNCPNFINVSTSALGNKGKWVPCKHIYWIFCHVVHCNPKLDICIHQPTLSFDEVFILLQRETFVVP